MKPSSILKRLVWSAGIGLICFSLIGSVSLAAEEPKPINIGVSFDFTGPGAPEARDEFPVLEMLVKDVNAAGGINGRPIKLFVLDNSGDPTKTMGTLKVLKEHDNCVAIVYGIISPGGLAAKEWGEKNSIPIMAPNPLSDKLIQTEGKAWFFRSTYSNRILSTALLLRIKELGFKRLGFMGSTQALGTDVEAFIKENASKNGLDFVGSLLCEPKSKDLTIQAKRLRDMKPDAVMTANYAADLGVWARAVRSIGWKPYSTCFGAQLLAICLSISPPELFEGWESGQQIDFNKPAVRVVWDKYEAYTKKRYEDEKGFRMWDGARMLFEAIRLSNNPDNPEAIRDGFYKIKNFPIASGRPEATGSFELGRNYLLAEGDLAIVVAKSGKLVMAPKK
jgi:branched-chain amino acid transport system substrate-binding protein